MEIFGATCPHKLVIDTLSLEETANPVSKKLALVLGQITRRPTITSVLNISEGK